MAALTEQVLTAPPITYAACGAGGDTFTWTPITFLHFKNVNGASRTVNVVGQVPCSQGFIHNLSYTVPANDELFIAPLDGGYADNTGLIHLTYSAVVGLTVAVLAT